MGFKFGQRGGSNDTQTAPVEMESPKGTDAEQNGKTEHVYDDDLPVVCPPHTTERKLVAKIDLHVIPFLCIMYLLAFLGKLSNPKLEETGF